MMSNPIGERLRVLFVAYQAPMLANGGLRSLGLILKQLKHTDALLLTNMHSAWTDELARFGVETIVSESLNLGLNSGLSSAREALQVAAVNAEVFDLVSKRGVQLVHCNDPHALRSAAWGTKSAGAALVLNLRAIKADPEPSLTTLLTTPMLDQVIVLSADMARRLRERLGPSTPIDHVYSVVELDHMRPAQGEERLKLREQLGIPADAFAVGYAASFVPRKQQLELIEKGLPELLARVPNAHVFFLGDMEGDPEYGRRCRDAAAKLAGERIHFMGFESNVARWLGAWDVTVVASYDEGLARSMIESLACGTAVASFDVPSAREILEQHRCGAVFDIGDFAGLARQLVRWAAQPDELAASGRSGRAAAERLFRGEDVAVGYEESWRSVLERRKLAMHESAVESSPVKATLVPLDELLPILRCPRCQGRIQQEGAAFHCENAACKCHGHKGFLRVGGHPVLVDFEESVLTESGVSSTGGKSPIKRTPTNLVKRRALQLISAPPARAVRNTEHFIQELKQLSARPTLLVVGGATLGSGGTKRIYETPELRIVAFDIYATELTQFIADAHRIPLANESVDGVLIQAVLEHVLEPWVVAKEIHRVLKPRGIVYAETPFMQQVHEGAYDFARFTDSGQRWLFRDFARVDSGAVLGAGTQLIWSMSYALRSITRSHRIGRWSAVSLFWLRFLDGLSDPAFAIDAASAVYFLGRKTEIPLRPRQIVDEYRGAQGRGR